MMRTLCSTRGIRTALANDSRLSMILSQVQRQVRASSLNLSELRLVRALIRESGLEDAVRDHLLIEAGEGSQKRILIGLDTFWGLVDVAYRSSIARHISEFANAPMFLGAKHPAWDGLRTSNQEGSRQFLLSAHLGFLFDHLRTSIELYTVHGLEQEFLDRLAQLDLVPKFNDLSALVVRADLSQAVLNVSELSDRICLTIAEFEQGVVDRRATPPATGRESKDPGG